MVEDDAELREIESGVVRRRLVAGETDAQSRGIGPHKLRHGLHHRRRRLVHRQPRALQPALGFEVLFKVAQERRPILRKLRPGRITQEKAFVARGCVGVIQPPRPGKQRVTVDLPGDAAAHRELHVAVEHRVIEAPGAIGQTHVLHHGTVIIVIPSAPWPVGERRRDDLLPALGQFLEIRPHHLEMLLAPRFDVVPPRDRPRVLPQIEMKLPVRRRRQGRGQDFELERNHERFHPISPHGDRTLIFPRLRIRKRLDGQPEHAVGARRHVGAPGLVEQVARQHAIGKHLLQEANLRGRHRRCL